MQQPADLKSMEYQQLECFITGLGEKRFRAKQIYAWLYKGVSSFSEMSDISKALQEKLSQTAYISKLSIAKKLISKLDQTTKYLFRLQDGNFIETVVMFYHHGATICLSTQVGCKMGCKFCASAIGGFVRDLTAGEMMDQILTAQKDLNVRISNLVLMGMGEPLDNFENTVCFLRNAHAKDGLNIGYRHITLSTCGLTEKIRALMALSLPITLSISLHAPNDDIRRQLMPVAKKHDYAALLAVCREYTKETGRRITFEYTLIDGVNDSPTHARLLAGKLKGMLCHVNLIPVNEVSEAGFLRTPPEHVARFAKILTQQGIETTVRRELGADIQAACGQLRKGAREHGGLA